MAQIIRTTFQFKRGDAEKWNELNPILAEGEPGFELDTDKFKIGNGINTWKELPYKGEGNIVNAQTRNEFPVQGNENAIYKAQDEKLLYQWNPNASEYEVLGTFGETDDGDFITVDTELSTSSMNPVANKVIAMALQDFVKDHYTKQEVDTAIENTNKRIDLLEGTTHFRGVYPSLSDETLNTDLYEFFAGDIFIVENAEYICTTSGNLTLLEKANYEKLGDVTAEVERISVLEEKVGNEENGETEATGLYQAIADLESNKLDTAALNNYYSKDETYATTEIDSLLQEIDNREEVTTLGELVDTIIGDDVGLSMRTVAVAVVAEIVGKAPEAFNTLEEIAAWIEAHPNDVTAIVKRISDLETNVGKKVDKTDIINTLNSTALDKPLSAAMGKELNSLIAELSTDVSGKVTEAQVATAISNALKTYSTTTAMQTAISTALAAYAKADDIPTQTSQLENDSGYITETEADGKYAKPSDIPTVPQTLPNPYALTILGKTYTGGKAVSLTAEEIMEAIKTASGGVVAYLDGNRLVLSGNLPDATYTAYYELTSSDGTKSLLEIGELTLAEEDPDPVTYTIKWVNHDGEVLKTVTVAKGDSEPEYDGPTPTRAEDVQYTYTFKGWDKTVDDATGDVTYTATYTQTAIESTYTVTKNLTNCSISNTASSATHGSAYNATVTANSGYTLKSVTATMGGSAVTVTNGVINIPSVTGNIVITAVAEASDPGYVNLIPTLKDTNLTDVYNGKGYKENVRVSVSNVSTSNPNGEKTEPGTSLLGLMPLGNNGDVLHLRGAKFFAQASSGYSGLIWYYDADGKLLNTGAIAVTKMGLLGTDANGDETLTLTHNKMSLISGTAYFRLNITNPNPKDTLIMTRNTLIPQKKVVVL